MYSNPVTSDRCPRRRAPQRQQPRVQVVRAAPAEVPGDQVQQLLEVAVERRVTPLLDAQLDPHHHGLRRKHQVDRPLDVHPGHFGVRDPLVHRDLRQHGRDFVEPFGAGGEELLVGAAAFEQQREDRAQQVGVGARPEREVQVGDLRGLGAPRVDHDQLARGVVLDRVERVPGVAEPVGLPGVAAEHHQQVAVLDVLGGVHGGRAEQLPVDPEVAGLLLRKRVEVPRRVHPLQQRRAVRAAGVVALATAADVGERAGPARPRCRRPGSCAASRRSR